MIANNEDPDEMPPYHLGLHCLPKYLLTSIQIEKINHYNAENYMYYISMGECS